MGILNRTPDSFYDGGQHNNEQSSLVRINDMLNEGVDIVDVGGYSSRPGAETVSEEEEYARVIPTIRAIKKEHPRLIISIDTFRSRIATAAVEAGAGMVNDISGGDLDPQMHQAVGKLGVPYVLMHMRGTPQEMQKDTSYQNIAREVFQYFVKRVDLARKSGIKDVVLDPGFGFGKSLVGNYELLQQVGAFKSLELPMLIGLSRKSMIRKLMGQGEEFSLKGTMAMNLLGLVNGASIIRVHDVQEGVQTVQLGGQLWGS